MFGHDDPQQVNDQVQVSSAIPSPATSAVDPMTFNMADSAPAFTPTGPTSSPMSSGMPTEPGSAPVTNLDSSASSDFIMSDEPKLSTGSEPTVQPITSTSTPPPPANSDDLLNMKQEALQQLQPLVNHLEQTPEEEFRTVMMMIQASDDHTMLPKGFEAAKKITDDKARAQALLDIINEINYFTQHAV